MDFTRSQQLALAITPKFTGLLSILGSVWIIVEVLTVKAKRHNVYNRIMCAMSFFDVITSTWMVVSTWAVPKGSDDVAFAAGNDMSCSVQGFFVQAGIISPMYNFCLVSYYMLVVRNGVNEGRLKRFFEPAAHIFCISVAYVSATSGLYLNLYNNANVWCWIAPPSEICVENAEYNDDCSSDNNSSVYRWAFFFGPLWFIILLGSIILVSVYTTVRRREGAAMGSTTARKQGRSSVLIPGGLGHEMNVGIGMDNAPTAHRDRRRRPSRRIQRSLSSTVLMEMSQSMLRSHAVAMPRTMATQMASSSREFSSEDAQHVVQTIEEFATAEKQSMEKHSFGSRIVFEQSALYTMAFYASYTFATINRIAQELTGKLYFPLVFMHVLLVPLQGFFNVLVYRYGYILRLQQRNEHMSNWELFCLSWRWTFLGPPVATNSSHKSSQTESENEISGYDELTEVGQSSSTPYVASSESGSSNESGIGGVNVLSDGLGPGGSVNNVVTDMYLSYSEYPNMAAEEMVVVSTQFPRMVFHDSFSAPPSQGHSAQQVAPTSLHPSQRDY